MLDPAQRNALSTSWTLVREDTNAFTDRFYGRLFEVAPGVRPLFPADMRDQRRKLAETLGTLVRSLDEVNTVMIVLSRLGEQHAAYGALPEHYPIVGDTLIWAFHDQLGERFTPEQEAAWGDAFRVISSVMIEAQRSAPA